MRSGALSPVDHLEACLRHLSETEGLIGAWEHVDAEGALASAKKLDQVPEDERRGGLFGVPVGVKDVIDVAGMPTTAGFEPLRGSVATADAPCVEALRDAGAILLGKTVTAQFAWSQDAPKTRNPWDFTRTPGASSSGSAAAVAARQVPLGIGTQTTSSLLRPASYCGAVGFKPTFGRVSCEGVLPTSWSSDHVGAITRSVRDARLFFEICASDVPSGDPGSIRDATRPPRLAVFSDFRDRCPEEVSGAFDSALDFLRSRGAEVTEMALPFSFDLMLAAHWAIHNSEAVAIHIEQFRECEEFYLPTVRRNVQSSALIPAFAYVQAKRLRGELGPLLAPVLSGFDAMIAPTSSDRPPSVDGTADEGRMGNTSFQIMASLFGLPAVTLPSGLDADGLPFGVQLVGRRRGDEELLDVAAWCEAAYGPLAYPDLSAMSGFGPTLGDSA